MPNFLALLPFLLALMLSAGLLFNIQPMIGKMLLPLVGGSPAVWNVAMAFFQISLLLGYLLAHLFSHLSARWHGLAYMAALAVAWLFLPIALPAGWRPDMQHYVPLQVLTVLFLCIAVPFIALSLSAPTLQRLFASRQHKLSADPYFLYAASNFGSFAGLLIYPFWFERQFDVQLQAEYWRYAYGVLILLAAVCVLPAFRSKAQAAAPAVQLPAAKTAWKQRLYWVYLAFIPSSLTLGIVTYISTDIAPTPLLWVATLGIYLLTYVLAFAKNGEGLRKFNTRALHYVGCLTLVLYTIKIDIAVFLISLNLLTLFCVALACHTLLSRTRPAAGNLTEFYLWLSVGGALGGSFNAFLAPFVFNDYYEYPLVLLLGLLVCLPAGAVVSGRARVLRLSLFAMLIVSVLALLYWRNELYEHSVILVPGSIAVIITTTLLLLRGQRPLFALGMMGVFIAGIVASTVENPLLKDRSFFGVLRVYDKDRPAERISVRELAHGTTQHGGQIVRPNIMAIPSAYYSPYSPLGSVMRVLQPKHAAIVGLGSGAMNCYARPDDKYTFIEIDPLVIEAAKTQFTFLSDCPAPRIILGDGRIALAELDEKFDLIAIDAFSSDAIPVHLLTQQAMAMYLSKLNPDGIIMVHISNRYFRLGPLLKALANSFGLQAYRGQTKGHLVNNTTLHFPSEWMVLTRQPAWWEKIVNDVVPKQGDNLLAETAQRYALATQWTQAEDNGLRIWTDDYSNLFDVLK